VTTQLPLFPLPLVLFPGARLPLHIVEPRYRQLLADLLDTGRGHEFGVLFRPDETDRAIPPGQVGCVATIERSERLPDGRANIIARGRRRFRFDGFVPTDRLYQVGAISPYEDAPETVEALAPVVDEVRTLFHRVATAAGLLANDRDVIPTLPDHPGDLAFAIAAMIDLDAPARQRLLASRSPRERLREIAAFLGAAVEGLEERAIIHTRAKHNGHGPPPDAAAPPAAP
jgi:Lon protease-like protein